MSLSVGFGITTAEQVIVGVTNIFNRWLGARNRACQTLIDAQNGEPRGTERTALLVLGMHRSGTSALTRLLNIAGAELPANMLMSNPSNVSGHWESQPLLEYHDAMLAELGSSWQDWRALDIDNIPTERRVEIRNEIAGILKTEYGDEPLFVVKEPRVCRFLPLFIDALTDIGATVRVALIFRNPLEVMASLEERNGLAPSASALLWLRHVLDAEAASRALPRAIVTYEGLLGDWRSALKLIGKSTGVRFSYTREGSKEIDKNVARFLDPSLRHYSRRRHEISLDPILRGWIEETYDAMQTLARNQESKMATAALNAIHRELNRAEPIFHRLYEETRSTEQKNQPGTRLLQSERTAEQLRSELVARDEKISDLNAMVTRSSDTIAQLKEQARTREATHEKTRAEIKRAELKLEEYSTHADALLRARDELIILSENERARAAAYQASYDSIRMSMSWQITAPIRFAFKIFKIHPVHAARAGASYAARALWKRLPLSEYKRILLRKRLKRATPALVKWLAIPKNQHKPVAATSLSKADSGVTAFRSEPAPSTQNADTDGGGNGLFQQLFAASTANETALDYVPLTVESPPAETKVKAIAFYLPQYHPIPENDEWWGKGFTEWANVAKAVPQFEGHYQPRQPGELGFYDLRVPEVQARQIELAKLYGIHGFCFHYYWFTGGKRLLERPLNQFLDHAEWDFPFCICWANENWTRSWDGNDDEILIEQRYEPQDGEQFIEDLAPVLKDPRYIRVDGKPLIIVYQTNDLPNPRKTAEIWRQHCRSSGIGDLFLVAAQSFGLTDPRPYGFDAAVEFPPHNLGHRPVHDTAKMINDVYEGHILDYEYLVAQATAKKRPDYVLFRTVAPGWDNEARIPGRGQSYVGSSPLSYFRWLDFAVKATDREHTDNDQKFVFINAWNEWAEGAYLEPDRRYGYAYLDATRKALTVARTTEADEPKKRIIVCIHDLNRTGSQLGMLNIVAELSRRFGYEVAVIAGKGGALKQEVEVHGRLFVVNNARSNKAALLRVISDLRSENYEIAICNSSASGWAAECLAYHRIKLIGLVHELPLVVSVMQLEPFLLDFDRYSERTIFASSIVEQATCRFLPSGRWRNPRILPQGVYHRCGLANESTKDAARRKICSSLKIDENSRFFLGAGYADHRKGVDIFIKWAQRAQTDGVEGHFIWIGDVPGEMEDSIFSLIEKSPQTKDRIHFVGYIEDPEQYFLGADCYLLTSREDPFPSTAIEALGAATPLIMVSGTGGIEDLGDTDAVIILPKADAALFAKTLKELASSTHELRRRGLIGRDIINADFGFTSYVAELLRELGRVVPRISAIVPNFNYSRHLEQRLNSILDQTLPVSEIVFLDDASEDDSVAVAERILGGTSVQYRIVRNNNNSGSVFKQWRKGVELARGDYIWIAEADDWADPRFLEETTKGFSNLETVLGYSQSNQANEAGEVTATSYQDYVKDISAERWMTNFLADGETEIIEGLSVKNTLPNVSAVVFRREPLARVLADKMDEIQSYRVAGDWFVHVNVLREGGAYFEAQSLNFHRRHDASVTISRFELAELGEIARMQAYVAKEFDVSKENREKARRYLVQLIETFGLDQKYSADQLAAATNFQDA